MKKIVVAYGKQSREMGYQGDLPWKGKLPADFAHVKQSTMGGSLIMGRATFDSIGRPLPGRENIVVTSRELNVPGIIAVRSLAAAYEVAHNDPVVLFGGVRIYEEALRGDDIDIVEATEIDGAFTADTFFPALSDEWRETSRVHHQPDERNKYAYDFVTYSRH